MRGATFGNHRSVWRRSEEHLLFHWCCFVFLLYLVLINTCHVFLNVLGDTTMIFFPKYSETRNSLFLLGLKWMKWVWFLTVSALGRLRKSADKWHDCWASPLVSGDVASLTTLGHQQDTFVYFRGKTVAFFFTVFSTVTTCMRMEHRCAGVVDLSGSAIIVKLILLDAVVCVQCDKVYITLLVLHFLYIDK